MHVDISAPTRDSGTSAVWDFCVAWHGYAFRSVVLAWLTVTRWTELPSRPVPVVARGGRLCACLSGRNAWQNRDWVGSYFCMRNRHFRGDVRLRTLYSITSRCAQRWCRGIGLQPRRALQHIRLYCTLSLRRICRVRFRFTVGAKLAAQVEPCRAAGRLRYASVRSCHALCRAACYV